MRQVGSLADQQAAVRFTAFLVVQGTDAIVEKDPTGWAIWVREENHINEAREAFQEFQRNPQDARYNGVEQQAINWRRDEQRRREESRKNVVTMSQHWRTGMARRAPATFILIAVCVLASIFTDFANNKENWRQLSFTDQSELSGEPSFSGDGDLFGAIGEGEVWRLITPIFVHGSWMHLVFNVYWAWVLGSQIENKKGTLTYLYLVLVSAIVSNVAQATIDTPYFLGFSGVGYALFGYVWMKSTFEPASGISIDRLNSALFIIWFFLGLAKLMPVANVAHGVGLAVGVLWGYWPQLVKKRT